nr:hypothetical protein [Roseovarius sp. W115]
MCILALRLAWRLHHPMRAGSPRTETDLDGGYGTKQIDNLQLQSQENTVWAMW